MVRQLSHLGCTYCTMSQDDKFADGCLSHPTSTQKGGTRPFLLTLPTSLKIKKYTYAPITQLEEGHYDLLEVATKNF